MSRETFLSLARVCAIPALGLTALILLGACGGAGRKVLAEDRIGRLKRDINKVNFAIRTTKTLISRARGERYLPDLYLRQAELFVESAKYHYHLTYERQKDKSGGVVSVQTRLLKNQAIATYRRLLALYPNYRDGDKVHFFLAHELRELGEYEEMLKAYLELEEKHPKSDYRLEGLLIVGDYYFDKAELDQAEKYYRMVIDSPETRVHSMARYKLAWCKINRADFKGALKLFEGSVRAARTWLAVAGGDSQHSSSGSKIDLRREALVDSVYSYTEVHKHAGALEYFKVKADSKTTYLAALEKLGNRYYIKQNWPATAMVYREILSLTGDNEDSLEYAHRLFESVTNGKLYDHGAQDVAVIIDVIRRRYHNHTLDQKSRKKLLETFEKYARDIATRLHDLATAKKDEEKFQEAAQAYTSYLEFFERSKHAGLVLSNLAEALYAAKRYLKSGHYYELAADTLKGSEQREAIHTAVASYFEALKGKEKLTRLDVIQGRAGLQRAGKRFIKLFPKDEKIMQVKFNIARTHYDAGEFDQAIRYFTALVYQYPASTEAPISAHLVLDAYRNMEDNEGLIAAGKDFQSMSNLGDGEFKGEVAQIVKGAENRLLDSATLDAADEDKGKSGSEQLEAIADKFKGTELECKALINAFVTARGANDTDRVFEIGEKLVRACPTSDKLPDVLATMGKLAVNAFQFATGAAYLEAAARRKKGSEAADMFKASCTIRAGLGLRQKAEESLNTFMRMGDSAADKGDLAAKVAQLHAQAGDWGAVINLLNKAIGSGASSAQLFYLLGYAYYKKGDNPSAGAFLNQAVNAGRAGTADDREAAAAAQFYLGEIAFKDFEAIQLSSDLSQLGPTLQNKIQAIKLTQAAYVGVVGMRSAVWSVAALGRLSSVDAAAATSLRSLALPEGLPEEVVKQVKGALESNAAPLAKEAQDALKQCQLTSMKLKVLSEVAKACLAGKAPSDDPQADVVVPTVTRTVPPGAQKLGRKLIKDPSDLPTITQLATLHLKNGNPYMARLVLGKGLEVRETGALLNLAGVATARLGDHQAALDLFQKAVKKEPGNSYALLNQAALLAQYGYTKDSQKISARIKGATDFSEGDPRLVSGAVRSLGGGR